MTAICLLYSWEGSGPARGETYRQSMVHLAIPATGRVSQFLLERQPLMIHRNGKVYISHTTQDEDKYTSLVANLTNKQINCWTTISPEDSDTQLSQKTQEEIAGRDVFLRICTPAAAHSPRMQLEAWAFGATQAHDAQHGTPNQHVRIDLVMDTAYTPDSAHPAYLTINAITRPMNDWLVVLYREMGRMQATRAMSHRTMTLIVLVCVLAGFLLVVFLLTFVVLFSGTGFFIH